ncbi:PTPA-domain-containing protein [Schizophyllum commune H4-8]|uniref:Serine/threonine-protein phosphatase 2A activator n=1 Tax=Schizophyllum commune (strain H4-8 / FGSC 9210) TaxID=578458 RepID=D8PYX1_SCHCM|nr:PTPA-domain-containing protein [Schizophyllum commune H4-8]KAI5896141.1 PTPA-domain-containing protein [Schizophyllum commune H4-8]
MTSSSRLPPLREITPAEVDKLPELPSKKIKTDHDIDLWKTTRSYYDFSLFVRRLCESVVGRELPYEPEVVGEPVKGTLKLLDTLDDWIDEIPPQHSPQRFGNLAFRTWGRRLEEHGEALLKALVPHNLVPHILPYFLTSFGSFVRMDYGTGHEASFAMFLCCLTLTRFFKPEEEQERQLVFLVFVRYLRLCWRLQDVYRLEPAGSHGVWGLDDSCFLPYIFGSAQLRDQTTIPVDAVLRPSLPATNLYFMAIMRIHEVKHGPFHEHSSQLHAIATGVRTWSKVHTGLLKMFEAEVLGKRVVVQHIPLGGILEWNVDEGAEEGSATGANRSIASDGHPGVGDRAWDGGPVAYWGTMGCIVDRGIVGCIVNWGPVGYFHNGDGPISSGADECALGDGSADRCTLGYANRSPVGFYDCGLASCNHCSAADSNDWCAVGGVTRPDIDNVAG